MFATATAFDQVHRSTNDGSTWTQIMGSFTTAAPTSITIGGAGTIFVGGVEGIVLRSTNNGTNWLGAGLGGPIPFYMRFVGNKMFAGTDFGPFVSTNFGMTWTPSNTGLESGRVNFIALQDTNTLFASSDLGVFISRNNGATWSPINTGLPTLKVTGLRNTGTYLYVGTNSYGVWRRPLADILTAVDDESPTQPTEFSLAQNYPNPFNPVTQIEYALPHASRVKLSVFNVLGQLVTTLVDEERPAGRFSVEWNGKSVGGNTLGSGVYFYTMVAQSLSSGQAFARTNKMVFVK